MGGFTRLLHSGEEDDLMEEIPSFVADPLPDSVVPHEWYPVLNRPYAFVQWVRQVRRHRWWPAGGSPKGLHTSEWCRGVAPGDWCVW
jgi:hypothetical protein